MSKLTLMYLVLMSEDAYVRHILQNFWRLKEVSDKTLLIAAEQKCEAPFNAN